MKIVKSFLLGTGASFAVIACAQATELPVKVRPVGYVKICSLYGAGFYYMPGTDMCLKLGGFVRVEAGDAVNGNLSGSPLHGNLNSRYTSNLTTRTRGYITADVREQTSYGVARAYLDAGLNSNDVGLGPSTFTSNRAFVQWAGFTAGLARSFYDFYHAAAQNYRGGAVPDEDTGAGGLWVWAYTAQFGGGVTGTLSMEERRMTQIINDDLSAAVEATALSLGGTGLGYGGWQVPDIVGNVRIDQTWGSAQVMAVGHELNPTYYGGPLPTQSTPLPNNGHPDDTWGWVVGVGAHINTPFLTQGDYIEGEFNYTEGALRYLYYSQGYNLNTVNGGTEGYGVGADCVYGGDLTHADTTSCLRTSAWGAILSYEHFWTPQWHQSVTGAYMQVDYSDDANNILCALEGQGSGRGSAAVASSGCGNNWSQWGVASRLQWDVTKSFYLGAEFMYNKLTSARSATGFVPSSVALTGSACGGHCVVADQDNWIFTVRMQKSFLP